MQRVEIIGGLREEVAKKKAEEKKLELFQASPAKAGVSALTDFYENEKKISGKKQDAEKLLEVIFPMLEGVNNLIYDAQDKLTEYIKDKEVRQEKKNENETIRHFN